MRRLTLLACTAAAAAAALSVAGATSAQAAIITYVISNSPTATGTPGTLSPGTLSGGFNFNTVTNAFSSVALTIDGVGSNNLIGNYVLDTGTTSNASNLRVRGITTLNSRGEANTNSFLNLQFASNLGGSSDRIMRIFSYAGNPADLTTPPTVAFAVAAVPEPATWGMMVAGFGAMGFAMRRRQKVSARIRFA